MAQAEVRLHLLGPARLVLPDGTSAPLRAHEAALLALLVVKGPQARAVVMQTLWPASGHRQAQTSLRQCLHRLRLRLGTQGLAGKGGLLALDPAVRCDAALTLEAESEPPQGEFLAGVVLAEAPAFDDWLQRTRSTWQAACTQVLQAQVSRLEAQGRWPEMLSRCQRLLADDPGDEWAHRACMRAHHLRGERPALQRAWQSCQQAVREATGLEPSSQTRELAQQLLLGEEHGPVAPAPLPTQGPMLPLTLRRPPVMVGRDADVLRVFEAWRAGLAVLVTGVAGMGKTRLLQAVCERASHSAAAVLEPAAAASGPDGAPCCALALRAGDDLVTYGSLPAMLAEVTRRFGPAPAACTAVWRAALPQAAPPGLTEQPPVPTWRMHRAWRDALAHWRRRGLQVLAVDDLQFADSATQDLLLAGCWSAPEQRPHLLFACREGMSASVAAHRATAPEALQPFVLQLAPLDLVATFELLRTLALPDVLPEAAAAPLLQRSGGHPLWMLQLLSEALSSGTPALQALAETRLPLQAEHLIGLRLRRLSAPALGLLRVATVAEAEHSLVVAAEVLGSTVPGLVDAQAELEAQHLVVGERLAYDLVATAVLQALPGAALRALHEKLAQVLAQRNAADACVARHWHRAARPQQAAPLYEAAARTARRLGQPEQALALADEAMACWGACGELERRWHLGMQVLPWAMLAQSVPTVLQRVSQMQAWAANIEQRCDLELMTARLHLCASDARQALRHADSALELALQAEAGSAATRSGVAAPTGPHRVAAARAWRCLALALLGRVAPAARELRACQRWLDTQPGPARTRLDVHGALGFALHCAGSLQQALVHLHAAAELAQSLGDAEEAMEQWHNIMVCRQSLGQRAEAAEAGERAQALWRQAGEPAGVSAMGMKVQLATLLLADGRYDRVIALLQEALSWPELDSTASWRVIAQNRMALVWLRLGQVARARQVLTPLHAHATPGNRIGRLMIECRLDAAAGVDVRPLLRRALAAVPDAGAAVAAAVAVAGPASSPDTAGLSGAEFVDLQALRLLLAAHEAPSVALRLCRHVGALAAARVVPTLVTHALAREAQLLARMGRGARAAAAARSAVHAQQAAGPQDLEMVSFWAMVHEAALAGADKATADLSLRQAAAWMRAAWPHVPSPYRDSFVQRNPVNREMWHRAAQAGLLAGLAP